MNTVARRLSICLCVLLPILTVGCMKPAPPPPPPLPPPPPAVISRVTAAKKIFLSNAGADQMFANDMVGGANGSYDGLYASLKKWGYFQLVDAPAQADLIFAIRSTDTVDETEVQNWNPQSTHPWNTIMGARHPIFTLTILDPSTETPVYTIVSGAGYAPSLKQGRINFAISIDKLTDRIKALVVAPTQKQ